MKQHSKKFIQATTMLAFMLVAVSPSYAIYDPVAQQDCTPSSTETVCLTRSIEPAQTVAVPAFDPMPVVKVIMASNLPVDLKVQLLNIIVSHISSLIDTKPSATTYRYNGGTATLASGRYSFNFGCNTISGTYKQTGDKITFAPGVTTLMACAADLMDKDTQIAKDLAKVTTITSKDGNVTLTGSDVRLELKKK